jgi:hypothetical protein
MARFLMMVYSDPAAAGSGGPTPELVEKMRRYNEELAKAGTLLAADGLFPPKLASNVLFREGGTPSVVDGPYAESKEMVGGFWIMRAGSLGEAVAIAERAPLPEGGRIEVRQIAEVEDYSEEVQEARGPDLDLPDQTSA